MRAEMLPDPPRNEIRKLLRDYVDLAVKDGSNKEIYTNPDKLNQLIDNSEVLQVTRCRYWQKIPGFRGSEPVY